VISAAVAISIGVIFGRKNGGSTSTSTASTITGTICKLLSDSVKKEGTLQSQEWCLLYKFQYVNYRCVSFSLSVAVHFIQLA
jgi:hypothetical protein